MDGAGAVEAVGAAAQDDGVARLQADAGGVRPDIGPALIDHADDADRRGDAAEAQPVGAGPLRHDGPQGIRQRRNLLQPDGHGLDARRIQPQPVAQRGQPVIGLQIGGVGGEDALLPGAQGVGGGGQRAISLCRRGLSQQAGRRPRSQGSGAQFGGGKMDINVHGRKS
jgi:hypothetical protein